MDASQKTWTVRRAPGELALTLLRVVAGIILVVHGWMKLTDVSGWQDQLAQIGFSAPEVLGWFAIAAELLGGLGLIVGLLTPLAAFGAAAQMAAAIVMVHWGKGLLAQNGGFEFPLLLLCTALVFMLRGAGPISVDALLRKATRKRGDRKRAERQHVTPETGQAPPERRPKEGGKRSPAMHHKPGWSER